jgi:hypothetical protein
MGVTAGFYNNEHKPVLAMIILHYYYIKVTVPDIRIKDHGNRHQGLHHKPKLHLLSYSCTTLFGYYTFIRKNGYLSFSTQ